MKKNIQIGLASLLLTSMMAVGTAKAEDGWFIKPEGEFILIPSDLTRGSGETGLGAGLSFSFGYQFDAWQWEATAGWHYAFGSGKTQKIGDATNLEGDISENFFPIYSSVNYTFPFLQSIDTTFSVGGGMMIYSVNKTFTTTDNTTPFDGTASFDDTTSIIRGLLVPKIELIYALDDQWTLILAGKFYMVFGGYNEVYSDSAIDIANTEGYYTTESPRPEDGLLWYSGVTIGSSYRF
ncbi:MAG: hypothetical protein ACR2NY_06710 [Alphaproteobacteria bacterium]